MRENEGLFSFYIIFDGIYGSGNVRMQLESPITARWSYRRVSQRVRNCRALGSASCLLRQKNGSHVTDETQGIESALHRRDVWVSVGKQVRQVSRGTSAHFTNSEIAEISHYYGMAKVNILPPYKVFNLALPYRRIGKSTFLLCGTCVCLRALVQRGHGESYFVYTRNQ